MHKLCMVSFNELFGRLESRVSIPRLNRYTSRRIALLTKLQTI